VRDALGECRCTAASAASQGTRNSITTPNAVAIIAPAGNDAHRRIQRAQSNLLARIRAAPVS
jgi:hypothetical protein